MSSSMAYNAAAGLSGMLSAGSRHFADDNSQTKSAVVLRNIDACLQLSRMLSTSLGPQGRHKLVQNHLGKLIITSDCASILQNIEVEHPAAQLLKQAVSQQESESGDATNFVLCFGGELLFETAKLISKMTWQNAPEILSGFKRSLQLITDDYLPKLVLSETTIQVKREDLLTILKPVLSSKVHGHQDTLAPLVADACLAVLNADTTPANNHQPTFNVDAVRTVKLIGKSVQDSQFLTGYVSKLALMSTTKRATSAKIAVFACGFEASSTEAKSTVLMKSADDLKQYNISEEQKMKELVESVVQAGVSVVVSGGTVSDMALHFLNANHLVVLKVNSKWELRRLCQAVGATALVRLGPPTPDEMGYADRIDERSVAGKVITVMENKTSKLSTILLRASTSSLLNDLERAVDDGVRAVKTVTQQPQVVYGGGACEMQLSVQLTTAAGQTPGLEQYAMEAFANALKVVPKLLLENAGWNTAQVLADLQSCHAKGQTDMGVDISRTGTGVISMKQAPIYDLVAPKLSALQLAVDAVTTILKVDQIIMSKPAK